MPVLQRTSGVSLICISQGSCILRNPGEKGATPGRDWQNVAGLCSVAGSSERDRRYKAAVVREAERVAAVRL